MTSCLQICAHSGTEIPNPDYRDRSTTQNDVHIQRVAEVIEACFSGVKPEPSIVETCIYSVR